MPNNPDDQPVSGTGRDTMVTLNIPASARVIDGGCVISTQDGHAPFTRIVITGPKISEMVEQNGSITWNIRDIWTISIE